jgi:hypothetical protein
VGLTIPSLLGAGSASLRPAQFGTGSGILNMGRQVGTVLGVAGLVAILSRVSGTDPIAAYRNALLLVIAFFGAAGVASAALLSGRQRVADGSVEPTDVRGAPAPVASIQAAELAGAGSGAEPAPRC